MLISCGSGATQVEGQFNETALQGVGLPNHAASKVIDPLDFARQIARSGAPATQPYEFERFGVDIKASLEMTEEFCDILDRAFSPDAGPLRLILPAPLLRLGRPN
jgi:hypothetical protein